uniref:Uncharacterized protein n=1 Tax=Podoviridae sp. ctQyH19 TaxID=2825249 RepID=A0A8S5UQY4_9CAUD|nr:MAG TPA: hypothetical protein [Podoviridae sp. ctQyH19]
MFITGKYIDIFNNFVIFKLNGLLLSFIKLDVIDIHVRVRSNIENSVSNDIIKFIISNYFYC